MAVDKAAGEPLQSSSRAPPPAPAPSSTSTARRSSETHAAPTIENAKPAHEYPYPLDIIVQNIQNVVINRDADDSSDEDAAKEVNHVLKLQGFKVVEKENGADCEFVSYEPMPSATGAAADDAHDSQPRESTIIAHAVKAPFKKGHRRAVSMPNAHHRDKATLVVAENDFRQEGPNRRHVVRYRLHPYTANDENTAAVTQFIKSTRFDGEDDDIEVTYDETEIDVLSGENVPRYITARRFWETGWKVQDFDLLPVWLQDNEFLRTGHRPPMPSFVSCFKSVFNLHSESGNIMSHLYGCVAFVGVALFFLASPNHFIYLQDKLVFSSFFIGAITCLGLSFSFHTVQCHSKSVGSLFSKLDYSGITLLIAGSMIPFIYYGFYCRTRAALIYITMVVVLGIAAFVVSMFDVFAVPKYRALRALVFIAMGLSSVVPNLHLLITDGIAHMINYNSIQWILLMGLFYLAGAAIYAFRLPERFCPGRCDLYLQSHILFHLFVVIAASVHFHGLTLMAMQRLQQGSCSEQLIARTGTDAPTDYFDATLRDLMF